MSASRARTLRLLSPPTSWGRTICSTDWGPGLASIAAASVPDLRVFHLSEEPVVDTIQVRVNEEQIDTGTLWFYDTALSGKRLSHNQSRRPCFGLHTKLKSDL